LQVPEDSKERQQTSGELAQAAAEFTSRSSFPPLSRECAACNGCCRLTWRALAFRSSEVVFTAHDRETATRHVDQRQLVHGEVEKRHAIVLHHNVAEIACKQEGENNRAQKKEILRANSSNDDERAGLTA
jgi:hypothetical protein